MARWMNSGAVLSATFLAFVTVADGAYSAVWMARYEDHGIGKRQLIAEPALLSSSGAQESIGERSFPQYVVEHDAPSTERIVEVRAPSRSSLDALLAARGVAPAAPRLESDVEADEVVTLVNSGPATNRIDLVFMGDGYTAAERGKFFADIQRMVNDMFGGDTFKSYLPVFNVHAVFRASEESGIGKNDTPRNTAYKLYREGDTLRAIFPGDSRAARASCAAAPGCDYPVIIANDPNYGGLGGEFAISTSSFTSGTVVLRHELGHNFGRVGEEYDGGGYFGANWIASLSGITWKHWATDAQVRAEPTVARFLGWPWHNLSMGPFRAPFQSDGRFAKAKLRFSASGIGNEDSITVTMDGEEIPITPPGTNDRTFFDIDFGKGFSAGAHELRFVENVADGNNWVSNLTIHEFGADYNDDPDFIGAFPVFGRTGNVAGYRSNDERCLMRNMQSTRFCSVCQENNWLEFFGKIKLIDTLGSTRNGDSVTATLGAVKLAGIKVTWKRNGVVVDSLTDQMTWTLPVADATGRWEVEARFVTREVRKDTRNLLRDVRGMTI